MCHSVKSLGPVGWWHGSLKEQGANNVVNGTNNTLGSTVLGRGVWARHPEVDGPGEEECASTRVIKLATIVAQP